MDADVRAYIMVCGWLVYHLRLYLNRLVVHEVSLDLEVSTAFLNS